MVATKKKCTEQSEKRMKRLERFLAEFRSRNLSATKSTCINLVEIRDADLEREAGKMRMKETLHYFITSCVITRKERQRMKEGICTSFPSVVDKMTSEF